MVENKSSQGRSRLFKRVIACLFPVAMLFALVGCNHPASVDSSKPSDSDVASDSTSETASDSSSSSSSNQTDSAVPEYQGMTVKRSAESTANGRKYNADNPSSSDSSGTEGDGTPDKDISDVVDVTVTNDQTVRYYVNKNETFIVDVHLSNPKQYEIQSFTEVFQLHVQGRIRPRESSFGGGCSFDFGLCRLYHRCHQIHRRNRNQRCEDDRR